MSIKCNWCNNMITFCVSEPCLHWVCTSSHKKISSHWSGFFVIRKVDHSFGNKDHSNFTLSCLLLKLCIVVPFIFWSLVDSSTGLPFLQLHVHLNLWNNLHHDELAISLEHRRGFLRTLALTDGWKYLETFIVYRKSIFVICS